MKILPTPPADRRGGVREEAHPLVQHGAVRAVGAGEGTPQIVADDRGEKIPRREVVNDVPCRRGQHVRGEVEGGEAVSEPFFCFSHRLIKKRGATVPLAGVLPVGLE